MRPMNLLPTDSPKRATVLWEGRPPEQIANSIANKLALTPPSVYERLRILEEAGRVVSVKLTNRVKSMGDKSFLPYRNQATRIHPMKGRWVVVFRACTKADKSAGCLRMK